MIYVNIDYKFQNTEIFYGGGTKDTKVPSLITVEGHAPLCYAYVNLSKMMQSRPPN